MSLKVPKAQNLQLFKDGYKVRLHGIFDQRLLKFFYTVAAPLWP